MNHHHPPDFLDSDDRMAADRRILHRLIDTLPDRRIPLVTGLLLRYAARVSRRSPRFMAGHPRKTAFPPELVAPGGLLPGPPTPPGCEGTARSGYAISTCRLLTTRRVCMITRAQIAVVVAASMDREATSMTVKQAAMVVLREAGQPLTAQEIAARILQQGLWQTKGKTPDATVAARLYTDIKGHGHDSAFVQVGPNTFGLREGFSGVPYRAKPTDRRAGRYSFTDAAAKVLEEFGDKKPMHYRDITKHALELDWVATEGKTPEATTYAQVLTEIRRYQKRGEQPRFVQHGRGYVGLSRWMGTGLAFEIEQHNKQVRQALHKRILAMEPVEFEELIGRLLAEIGFEDIEVTQRSRDGGIDVRGTLVVGDVIRTRMAVQAKKWKPKNRVQAPTVQQVRGSLGTHDQGLIITPSDFSTGARREAARSDAVPVALMNGEQLVALLAEYSIGVTRRSHELIDLEEAESS